MHQNATSKGDLTERMGLQPRNRLLPSSIRKCGKYVPAGERQNCGAFGINPKHFKLANGLMDDFANPAPFQLAAVSAAMDRRSVYLQRGADRHYRPNRSRYARG